MWRCGGQNALKYFSVGGASRRAPDRLKRSGQSLCHAEIEAPAQAGRESCGPPAEMPKRAPVP